MKLLPRELVLIAMLGVGYSCNAMETEKIIQSRAGTPVPRYIPQVEKRYPHDELIKASWESNLDEICRLLISFSGKLVHGENLVAVIYLHKVAEEARKEFVDKVKQKGMKIEYFATKEGWTALHFVSTDESGALVRELVRRGAPVNARTNTGLTPLHRAAAYGWKTVVEILLECGALIDYQDVHGATALHWATFYGNADIVSLLLARGANSYALTEGKRKAIDVTCDQEIQNLLTVKNA